MRGTAALLAAVCVSVVTALALAFPFGGLGRGVAVVSLCMGAGAGLLAAARTGRPSRKPKSLWEWIPIVVFVLFSLRAFCWLIFADEDDIKILSPNNLGDIALHLTYIDYLANGVRFWPREPIFPGQPLRYPVGVDLFNSLLVLCRVDVFRGLIWTGLAGCVATGWALYEWGGAFTLAGFLFNGGLYGFEVFRTGIIKDYQADHAWKSIPLALFVTQRGLLYALPAGLLLLASWRDRFFRGKPGRIPLALEVLLYGTMPLFHVHTFVFLSLLLGFWFVTTGPRIPLLKLVAWSVVPATVLVGIVCGFSSGGSIIHVIDLTKNGPWTQGDDNFFTYWFGNFGILPIPAAMLAATLLCAWRQGGGNRPAAAFVLPCAAIFLFACVVMLAPWEWDNIKLILWCYLALLPFLWENMIARWPFPARAAMCFALFFSGFISLLGGVDQTHKGYEFAKRSELEGVKTAVRGLPPDAVFAGSATYNHPLLLLGHAMVMGYPAHLWSHGYDYKGREESLKRLMMGGPDWRAVAARLKVRYLFWGDREEAKDDEGYAGSREPWKDECLEIAGGDWGALYDLSRPKK